jgi:hypothetical protein
MWHKKPEEALKRASFLVGSEGGKIKENTFSGRYVDTY